jgi:hypothetical protein
VVSSEDLLFLLLGVAPRFWIEYLMRPAIFAVVLLRATGTVAVFDDVGGAAFSALVGLFDHRTRWPSELETTSLKQKLSLLVEPLPEKIAPTPETVSRVYCCTYANRRRTA